MMTKPPLHIDFVKKLKYKKDSNGYWFLTWINDPGGIEVWMKCHDGGWNLEAGGAKEQLESQPEPPFGESPYKFIRKGFIRAMPKRAKELDDLLIQHMNKNGIEYKYPHKYWSDPDDPPDPLDTEGLVDYYRRNASQ